MAAIATRIPIETCLEAACHPDRVDGKIEERYRGKREHARLQMAISAWFCACTKEGNIDALSGPRVRGAGWRETERFAARGAPIFLDRNAIFGALPQDAAAGE